jgi:alkylated DNA repair dioxygenase AlkB
MYSGITVEPKPWTDPLKKMKERVEEVSEVNFNSVLLNRYRNGRDSVSWHSDDEPELGKNPIIGSVSFGDVRDFQLRHKTDKSVEVKKYPCQMAVIWKWAAVRNTIGYTRYRNGVRRLGRESI